jgi:hypothetical protein
MSSTTTTYKSGITHSQKFQRRFGVAIRLVIAALLSRYCGSSRLRLTTRTRWLPNP